ncbi:hypothetical protein H6P81_009204 [Aristolochia fimbriata]|uniref:30S ribosomal protein S8, chloroplastic n=1 Tax=Aristolochia fimbriata TaxID=158543 RepID=A0AAV7EKS5_ARIFI|nr:hypothetical protein H6P81_009204 [Aristolochia fimbriata]
MGRRILNDALRTIVNAERRGKATANLQPISNVMSAFLVIMKHRGYIKDYQANTIEEYVQRALPTRQWGYVVISTPNGVLDREEAIRQNLIHLIAVACLFQLAAFVGQVESSFRRNNQNTENK